MYCRCGSGDGFTKIGEWWVCAKCNNPSRAWLAARGDDNGMLNFFRGGPLDGSAYDTSTLLNTPDVPITRYKWTSEVIESKVTGRSARVWIFDESLEEKTSKPAGAIKQERGTEMSETNLAERRTAAKVSRSKLSEVSGLTQAKIARIERGSTKTTDEETKAYNDGLAKLEQAAAAAAPAPDPS